MKVRYNANENISIELEPRGETLEKVMQSAFDFLAMCEEIFGQKTCEACGSVDIYYAKRTPKGYVFRTIDCRKCGCKLDIVTGRDGDLMFIGRQDKDKKTKGVNGWHKYDGGNRSESQSQGGGDYEAPRTQPGADEDPNNIPF